MITLDNVAIAFPLPPAERAVILCAGNGKRLGGSPGPKALLEVGGRTILERQVSALRALGVRDVVLVVGYERERVYELCQKLGPALDVVFTFVVNEQWACTNTAYSMRLAAPYMAAQPTYTLNGDVLFPRSVLAGLAQSRRRVALAIDVKPCGAEEVKVALTDEDELAAIDKRLGTDGATGEFIGLARFDAEAGAAFARALDEELGDAGLMTYYDYALSRMARAFRAHGVRFQGVPMIEIDFPEDLARARDEVEPRIRALDAQAERC